MDLTERTGPRSRKTLCSAPMVCGLLILVACGGKTEGEGDRSDAASSGGTGAMKPASGACGTRCKVTFEVLEDPTLRFTSYTSPGASQIWGSAWDDVWAVSTPAWDTMSGPQSGTCHWNGSAWTCSRAEILLSAIWGTANGRVFAGGHARSTIEPEMVEMWDGDWKPWTYPNPPVPAGRFGGSSERDLWAIDAGPYQSYFADEGFNSGKLAHFDGATWRVDVLSAPARGFHALSEGDVWAVGEGGLLAHYQGSWSEERVGSVNLNDLWVTPQGQLWVVGEGAALRQQNGNWENVLPPELADLSLVGIWGAASDSVWVIGNADDTSSIVLRWDGSSWSKEFELNQPMYSIWGSDRDVWIGADRAILRGH